MEVKVSATVQDLWTIRKWLKEEIGLNKCHVTPYKGESINWRKVSKVDKRKQMDIFDMLDATYFVAFKQTEDALQFLEFWPGEIVCQDK
jgi:hypothetical protein